MMSVSCIFNQPCILGEGPIWHPQEKVLYWVDIVACELHRLNIKNNEHHSWKMPTNICCISPNKAGGIIAALKNGIAILNPVSAHVNYIATLSEHDAQKTMFNDGHCDHHGQFWVGTKDIAEKNNIAAFYCLTDAALIEKGNQFTVANGLVFNQDNTCFYIADSPNRFIYRYDVGANPTTLVNKKVFATIADDAGYPDGMAIDSQGYLWSCHFNGWRITRYAPDGKVDCVIKMPVSAPTSCCFGGDDLKTLFITSAKRDVSEAELKNQPLAGCVFAINAKVAGINEPCFIGET